MLFINTKFDLDLFMDVIRKRGSYKVISVNKQYKPPRYQTQLSTASISVTAYHKAGVTNVFIFDSDHKLLAVETIKPKSLRAI